MHWCIHSMLYVKNNNATIPDVLIVYIKISERLDSMHSNPAQDIRL